MAGLFAGGTELANTHLAHQGSIGLVTKTVMVFHERGRCLVGLSVTIAKFTAGFIEEVATHGTKEIVRVFFFARGRDA